MSMGKRAIQGLANTVGGILRQDHPIAVRPRPYEVPATITGQPFSRLSVEDIQAWYQHTMRRNQEQVRAHDRIIGA